MKKSYFVMAMLTLTLVAADHLETARALVYRAYDTSDDEKAIHLFDEALKQDQDFIYAYAGRGLRKQSQGDLDGAIADFTEAIEKNALFSDAYLWRAKAKLQKGDYEGCQKDMEAANRAAEQGDYALIELDKSVEGNPQNAKTYLERARYKKHKEDFQGAIEDYNQYLLLVGRPNNSLVLFERANAKKSAGDIDGALGDYSMAIRMFPENADAYSKRADLRRKAGDIEGAEADLKELNLIRQAEKLGQIEKMTHVLKNAEDPSYFLIQRSRLWMETGNLTNALIDVRRVLEKKPEDSMAVRLEKRILDLMTHGLPAPMDIQ